MEERHAIMSFTVDKEDKYIAVNLVDQGVHLWDFRLKTLLRMFPGVIQRNFMIYSSFSSPEPTFLASGSEGKCDNKIYGFYFYFRNTQLKNYFNINNNIFLKHFIDGKVYIYHINKDQPVAILHGHSRCVNCVSWNPKYPEILVSVSDDRVIRVWGPTPTSSIKDNEKNHKQT